MCVTIVVLALSDAPELDTVGAFAVLAQFAAAWALGVALRNRRAATDARVREADERAEAERQSAGQGAGRGAAAHRPGAARRRRPLDVGHRRAGRRRRPRARRPAGAGARRARGDLGHVAGHARPRCAACSACCATATASDRQPRLPASPTCRGSSTTCGPPVCRRRCTSTGRADCVHAGIELSAYRVVQEALTNVIKHAGKPTRVDVTVRYLPGSLAVEVVDDGRGLAARPATAARRRRRTARGTASSACASGSSCGAASSRSGRHPAAGTASRRGCRTVTPNDDPGGGRRRPGARAQRLHDAARRASPTSRSSARRATAPRPSPSPPASTPT